MKSVGSFERGGTNPRATKNRRGLDDALFPLPEEVFVAEGMVSVKVGTPVTVDDIDTACGASEMGRDH